MSEPDAITSLDEWTHVFVCEECDRKICHAGRKPSTPVCCLCLWLDDNIADREERETLRERFAREVNI